VPGVRDIKRRIRSVRNIRQITKALQMEAAAKLRKTQEAVVSSRPYAKKLDEVLRRIVASAGEATHPLMEQRPVKTVGFLLVTADRGFAGGYNANLIRKTVAESARFAEDKVYFTVGRKGRDYMRRREKKIIGEAMGIKDTPTFLEAQRLARTAVELYLDQTFDQLYIVHQEFITAVQQKPVVKQLLPIPRTEKEQEGVSDYIYEPQPEQVLEILLPKYINNMIFQALMEAKASEQGARMTAMGSATDNAEEMINKLTLSFNRARQAAITKEISEIVGGANALKG